MSIGLPPSWLDVFKDEFWKAYMAQLRKCLQAEKENQQVVYPKNADIFNAFNLTPFDKVKVVILGQDPYHGPKQANGLAFAVHEGLRLPPSLQNIFKELESDVGPLTNKSGDLERWATQGVLLLNATLTVKAHTAGSHQYKGWEPFTDAAIRALAEERTGIVFMLWGRYAQNKEALIDPDRHYVLKTP